MNKAQFSNTDVGKFAAWCRNQWAILKNRGVWVVPRSGLTFTRTPEGFTLSDVARPVSEAFRDYQREDFACIAAHFSEAGFTVTDPQNLLGLEVPSAHS